MLKQKKHTLVRNFIAWAARRNGRVACTRIVYLPEGELSHFRFQPFWPEEWPRLMVPAPVNRPPWYRPFNIVLNHWVKVDQQREKLHDHVRWSVTIVLQGQLIEHTPWSSKLLIPGSIVIRSHKYIHSFSLAPEWQGKTWTMFIVGRRNHPQHVYTLRRVQ